MRRRGVAYLMFGATIWAAVVALGSWEYGRGALAGRHMVRGHATLIT